LSYAEGETTETVILGVGPAKIQFEGAEMGVAAEDGGCKCGDSCTCDPCNCKWIAAYIWKPLGAEIVEPICVIVCISTHLIYKKHVFPFFRIIWTGHGSHLHQIQVILDFVEGVMRAVCFVFGCLV